jgi:hypothetical protein
MASMQVTAEKNEQVARMTFASVYPHYVTKVEGKGRTLDELYEVIKWLTGYDSSQINEMAKSDITFRDFFNGATLHPNAPLIKGVICGYRIEDISVEFEVYRQVRYLDKLVDELAKGRKMEKILRSM